MSELAVNNKLQWICGLIRYYPSICLGMQKTIKNLSWDSPFC